MGNCIRFYRIKNVGSKESGKASKYGGKSRWHKLHIAMDLKTQDIILAEVRDGYELGHYSF
ncbi:hypothetical protein RSOCI_01510 [Rhabdochlamydiaceae symbiont of Dictyostelium giganteum]